MSEHLAPRPPRWIERTGRLLGPLDRVFNRIYGWRYNPIYQSGSLAVAMLLVLTATGLYQLYFYKIGSPYESVLVMQEQVWSGRWIRALHRYAADLMIAASVIHALRMFLQGRTWGPRALAWISGLVLVGILLLIGWSGYILVWDRQGQAIAMEGARLLDVLPIFSEPIRRSFITSEILTSAFFFLNLFIHIATPLGLLLGLWIHTVRVARPALLPPRPLLWGSIGALTALAIVWPAALPPKGDALSMLATMEVDWFYAFWVPLARVQSPGAHLVLWLAGFLLLASAPWWWRHRPELRLERSVVDERFCTGCTQCYKDCPYEAIAMVPRTVGFGSELVGHVNPELCVSCGICAGSCAPMRVGPPGRVGQDQIEQAEAFWKRYRPGPATVVVFSCRNGVGDDPAVRALPGVAVYDPLSCAGALHTSVIEYLLRKGAAGAYVLSCTPRDCVFREGPKWLEQRIYHDREAELQARVDRRRVRIGLHSHAGRAAALAGIRAFQADLSVLPGGERPEADVDLDLACEVMEATHG